MYTFPSLRFVRNHLGKYFRVVCYSTWYSLRTHPIKEDRFMAAAATVIPPTYMLYKSNKTAV